MQDYMDANELAYDKTGTVTVDGQTRPDRRHNKDGWEVAITSLQARLDALGTGTREADRESSEQGADQAGRRDQRYARSVMHFTIPGEGAMIEWFIVATRRLWKSWNPHPCWPRPVFGGTPRKDSSTGTGKEEDAKTRQLNR
jgi:hypothetical protein